MLMSVIYPKVNVDLISGTGSYDITVVESTTTCEWAPFFWKVRDLANQFDPNGFQGLIDDLKGHHYVALRSACDENGDLVGLPYYATQGAMMIRQDVFDDPTEKANFKAKYGYDLAPAQDWKDIYNQGEFFTRKTGDLLKGKALEWDTYGLTLMAGRFEINDEISGFLQGMGSDWATTIRDQNGKIQEFVITKQNKSDLNYILAEYQKNLIWCSPGCLTGFWDFCTAQFETGKTIVAPTLYVPLDQWAWGVVEKVGGGAKLGLYTTIGGSPFQGTFHQAVNLVTKNPEACYWLQRYLSCYEGQKQMCENGWNGVRADIYRDSKYQTDQWYRIIGQRAGVVMEMWDYQWPHVNDLLCRNSDAMGKIYEAQIIICHEAVTGVTTIDEGVRRMTETTIEIQRKFGSVPIREEV